MKVRFFILFVALCSVKQVASAQSINRVFDANDPIVWLGLDFTGAIFIGDREKLGSENDIRYIMGAWNSLMLDEKEKYNIHTMLGKQKVDYRLDVTRAHNDALVLKDIYSDKLSDHLHLKKSDIEMIVKSYSFNDLKGVGLMFIVESFNKPGVEASIWITFINLEGKEIFFTEKMVAPPSGFGLRNYWAGAIYSIMKKVAWGEFEGWRNKYTK